MTDPRLHDVRHIAGSPYTLRLADTDTDLKRAQELRFQVFNRELGEGLASSEATGRDHDAFDAVCDHLIVECAGEPVGTYRLQTGETAAAGLGYYSEREFSFEPYEPLRHETIELGRACIHKDHRKFAVLNLLWRGIARYATDRKGRYLIGCSSLTSQNEADGAAAYQTLRNHLAPAELRTIPTPEFLCRLDRESDPPPKIPRLLSAYLQVVGARICGPPAIDREFKTIDFLTVLDLETLSPPVLSRYMGA